MTKEQEELLAEAKRRYPPGTKYVSASKNPDPGKYTFTIEDNSVWEDSSQLDHYGGGPNIGIFGGGFIHYCGIWAEIIESPKPQFIPGKWYKSDVYYLKFERLEPQIGKDSNHKYNLLYGEKIASGNYKKLDYYANSDLERKFLENGPLTDLTEIQQYLPDGHPDKIIVSKELTELPEKWCISRNISLEQNKVVTKWMNRNGSAYSDFIVEDWYHYDGKHGSKKESEHLTEITFDQFKKWVLKEEAINISDGWCVEVTPENREVIIKWWGDNSSDKKLFTIGAYYGIKDGVKKAHGDKWDNVITTEEFYEIIGHKVDKKHQSLVGRYLKALVDRPNGGFVKKGEVGKIINATDGIPNNVNFPSQSNYGIAKTTYEQGSYYELMPEGFTPEQNKNYVGEAVHCKTQEEWDFVISKIKNCKSSSRTYEHSYENKANDGCLALDDGCHCPIKWYNDNNYKIYSFEEWCTKFGHKMEAKIPGYVECVQALTGAVVGKIYPIINERECLCDNGREYLWKAKQFKPSTKEAFDAQNKPKDTMHVKCIYSEDTTRFKVDKEYPITNLKDDCFSVTTEIDVYHNCPMNGNLWKFKLVDSSSSNIVCGLNLIPGEVYSTVQDTGTHWIMRFYNLLKDDSCINSSSVNLASKKFYKESAPYWGSKHSIKSIRLATPEEKAHFEVCEKAGRYVDAPKMESILEEAKKRYPIGTEIKPLNSNYIYIYNTEPIIISSYAHHIHTNCIDENEEEIWFTAGKFGVTVYSKGKWCDKVYSPKQEEKWVPKVGDWVVGWHATDSKYSNIPWKIIKINTTSGEKYAVPEGGYSTDIQRLRKAEPHEIPNYPGTSTETARITIKVEDMPTQSHTLSHPWPVGTRVKINPSSEYRSQSNGSSGTITDNQYDKSHIYRVKWDKGVSNCYRPEDLLLENPLLNGLINPGLVKEMVDFSEKYSIKPTDAQISREVSVDLYVPKGNNTLDTKVTRSRPVTIDLKKESKVLLF